MPAKEVCARTSHQEGEGSSLTVLSTIADAYHGRTILITGGRGYIGSALTLALANVHCKLILLDRSPLDVWVPDHRYAEISIVNGDVSTRYRSEVRRVGKWW